MLWRYATTSKSKLEGAAEESPDKHKPQLHRYPCHTTVTPDVPPHLHPSMDPVTSPIPKPINNIIHPILLQSPSHSRDVDMDIEAIQCSCHDTPSSIISIPH